jgi:hypothetical protein
LVAELDRAASLVMSVVRCRLADEDYATASHVRSIFEQVTGLPGLRIDLVDRFLLNGDPW